MVIDPNTNQDPILAAILALKPTKRQKLERLFSCYFSAFIEELVNGVTPKQIIKALKALDPDYAMSRKTFTRRMVAAAKESDGPVENMEGASDSRSASEPKRLKPMRQRSRRRNQLLMHEPRCDNLDNQPIKTPSVCAAPSSENQGVGEILVKKFKETSEITIGGRTISIEVRNKRKAIVESIPDAALTAG